MARRRYSLPYALSLLLVAGLLLAGQLVLERYLEHLGGASHVVNLAGRQRMLSEQVVRITLLLPQRPDLQPSLAEDLDRFQRVHQGLLRGDVALDLPPAAPELAVELERLPVPELVGTVQLARTGERRAIEGMLATQKRFLDLMETVVNLIELRSEVLAQRLRLVQLCVRVITLGAVLLMFALLFRPVQAELERVDSELSQVLENSTELIGSLNSEGELTYVNHNWTRTLGYPELIGKKLVELLASPESRQAWEEARKPGRQPLDLTFLNQAGKRVQADGVVVWTASGGSCYWRDVTQTRRLQETFDRFFHLSQDMLCITDRQGRFLKLNPAWEKAAGYGPGGQLGHSFLEYVHPDDLEETTAQAMRLSAGEGTGSWENRARRADGVYRWLLWSCAFDSKEQVFYSTVRDISERKQLEEDLLAAKQGAEQASRAKSSFLANMSHELRTPMNSILGFAQLLEQQSFGPLNPRQARQVGNILSSGQHLLSLINDILDLSKIEVGRLSLHPMSMPIKTALEQQLTMVGPQAAERQIELQLLGAGPEGLQVVADPARLNQILLNLLSNAIKFTPPGGLVQVGVEAAAQEVMVWVRDNGIGVHPHDHARIFERFEQVDSSFGRRQQGTGLGLSLTRQLVELQGGTIRVESTGVEGEGSRFEFTLPRG